MPSDLQIGGAEARLLLGRSDAPARPIELAAGPVTALLHEGDLRHVRLGDVELAQRIYVAVRDAVWNTIPGVIEDLQVQSSAERFHVTFTSEHRHEDIHFVWRADISGAADGSIGYRVQGEHRSSCRFAKIGLNVHHPIPECLGRPFVAQTPGGRLEGVLPVDIEPQLVRDGKLTGLFAPYDELDIELADGLTLELRFAGDLFEMQDHRNWTDANFKTYCTPVGLPWPFDAQAGDRLDQAVQMSFSGRPPARSAGRGGEVVVEIGEEGEALPMPLIGLGLPEAPHSPGGQELELLRGAGAAHLRFDLAAGDPDAPQKLHDALAVASDLDAGLELGVFATSDTASEARRLAPSLASAGRLARVLVFAGDMGFSSTAGSTTPTDLVATVAAHLGDAADGVPVAGGTNQFFTELNRNHPDPSGMDGLVYSINPQVHAADDWSLMENLRAQADTVAMAAKLAPGLPLFIGPVTLVGRYGPFPAGPALPGGPAANADPRQQGLFCAAWTVGSISELARAGVASISYFETSGPRGLVPGGGATAFPVYHVFADLAEMRPATILPATVSDPESIAALALVGAGRRRVLVANLTATRRRVALRSGLGGAPSVRALDLASVEAATSDPKRWREQAPAPCEGPLIFELGPYAVLALTTREGPS